MKEHDGKDDEEGERVNAARVEAAPGYRLYAPVTPDHLIRVTLKNLSAQPLSFVPVYVGKDGTKEEEDKVDLASGEVRVNSRIPVDTVGVERKGVTSSRAPSTSSLVVLACS